MNFKKYCILNCLICNYSCNLSLVAFCNLYGYHFVYDIVCIEPIWFQNRDLQKKLTKNLKMDQNKKFQLPFKRIILLTTL